MDPRDLVSSHLAHLGEQMGLKLALDPDGRCTLACEDDLECTLHVPAGAGLLVLEAPLAPARAVDREAFLEELLAINLHGSETDGCWLALDRARGAVVLSLIQPLSGLDRTAFGNVLGGFIATAQRLADRVGSLAAAAPAHAPVPMATPIMDMMLNMQLRA